VKFSGLNAVEAECSADALPVSQEVLDNNTITYQLGVVKSGSSVTYGDDNLYKPTAAEVKTILSGGKVTVAVPYDSDLATGAAYNAYLFTAYTSSRYPDGTLIDIDNTSDQGNEYVLTLTAPTVNLVDRPAFAKYEDRFWDGETTSSLGYFAHIAAQFEISGLPSDLNCYVGFNAQQKACYEDNIGCYPTNNADTDGFTMWRHSFAGTSAANGGAPLNFQFGNGSGAIAPIADYTEFETVDGQAWTATYDDAVNNWSRLAAETGRLAIHVNPAYRYASESAFLQDGALSGKIDVKVKVYVPLDETRRYTIAGKTGSNAPRRASGTAALVIPELTAAADVEQIDLSEAGLVTGIGQVTADDTATAVYYNLQGIRVNNPVAGQFYIEVCGRRATKILYR
jgi:hypothetical protein